MSTIALILYLISQALICIMIWLAFRSNSRMARLILELIEIMEAQEKNLTNHRNILSKLISRKTGWFEELKTLENENRIWKK